MSSLGQVVACGEMFFCGTKRVDLKFFCEVCITVNVVKSTVTDILCQQQQVKE
jgi:hypothetical protein